MAPGNDVPEMERMHASDSGQCLENVDETNWLLRLVLRPCRDHSINHGKDT